MQGVASRVDKEREKERLKSPGSEEKLIALTDVRPIVDSCIKDANDLLGGFRLTECGRLLKLEGLQWADLTKDERMKIVGRYIEHVEFWGTDREVRYGDIEAFGEHVQVDPKVMLKLFHQMKGKGKGTEE